MRLKFSSIIFILILFQNILLSQTKSSFALYSKIRTQCNNYTNPETFINRAKFWFDGIKNL